MASTAVRTVFAATGRGGTNSNQRQERLDQQRQARTGRPTTTKTKTKTKTRPRSHSSLMDDEVALRQGLTLVHFSAQLERILWDRGAFRGCLEGVWQVSGGFKEHEGMSMVYFVSETAQVELRTGRV